jgi:hypothetical protein
MLALTGIAAFSADAEMIRRRPIQQCHCSLYAGLFPQASVGSICSVERAAMRARVIFISKHRCRLGGDCADLFRPPRADDHRVTSNRSSKAPSIGEKLEMRQIDRSLNCLNS